MFVYETLLVTGALGIVVMTLMGFAHAGGAHHGGHTGGAHGSQAIGEHLAPGGHASHGAAAHTGQHGGENGQDAGHAHAHAAPGSGAPASLGTSLLALLSPMSLFAACLGAGVAGLLLTGWGVAPVLAGVGAAGGAVVFNALLVRPILRLVMSFASEPARGLEGALMQSAEAVTAFDANGEGLVRVLVDGQSVDVLARLTDEERREGVRVVRGQTVRIEDVDTRSNRCKVSRL